MRNKTEKMLRIEAERGREILEIIREQFEAGHGWEVVAKDLGISSLTLRVWLRQLGVRPVTRRSLVAAEPRAEPDQEQPHYVYCLCDPDGTPRYVGLTRNLDQRLQQHLWEARGSNSRKNQWLRELRTAGKQPVFKVLAQVAAAEAGVAELLWMQRFVMDGHQLVNAAPLLRFLRHWGEDGARAATGSERATASVP